MSQSIRGIGGERHCKKVVSKTDYLVPDKKEEDVVER